MTDIINETRTGEWIVVDGRQMIGSTFYDCVLELRGRNGLNTRAISCTFDRCDFVGPWPFPKDVGQANLVVHAPRHEPEAMTLMAGGLFVKRKPVAKPRRWWFG